MRTSLAVVLVLSIGSVAGATPKPKPFLTTGTPRNPCDARPATAACLAEYRQTWRTVVAGTNPYYKHRTSFGSTIVYRWDGKSARTEATGWTFVVILPDPPAKWSANKLRIEVDGVVAVQNALYDRYTSPIGSLQMEIALFADEIKPGKRHLTVSAPDKSIVFEEDVELVLSKKIH